MLDDSDGMSDFEHSRTYKKSLSRTCTKFKKSATSPKESLVSINHSFATYTQTVVVEEWLQKAHMKSTDGLLLQMSSEQQRWPIVQWHCQACPIP